MIYAIGNTPLNWINFIDTPTENNWLFQKMMEMSIKVIEGWMSLYHQF